MSTPKQFHDRIRLIANEVAEYLSSQARWRALKQTEFPDDVRNGNAAAALQDLAIMVESTTKSPGAPMFEGIVKLAMLQEKLEGIGLHYDAMVYSSKS